MYERFFEEAFGRNRIKKKVGFTDTNSHSWGVAIKYEDTSKIGAASMSRA